MAVRSFDVERERKARLSDRRHIAFFPAMSVLLAVFVFVGFAPTYYLRPSGLPAIPFYRHLHGAALTLWFSLFIVQTGLIASRRRTVHRRLGIAGAILAAAILVLTPLVVLWAVPRLLQTEPIELTTLIVIGDSLALAVFAALVIAAMGRRHQPEAHSRLMLFASMAIMAPALGRASLLLTGAPIPGLMIHMALPLLVVGHDVLIMRRIHRATLWGSVAVVGSMLFSIAIANTETAHAIVRRLG